MFLRGVVALVLAGPLVLASCGDGSDAAPDVITAGQLAIKLPPGWTVTEDGARRPAVPEEAAAPAEAATAPTDTMPLAEEDPSSAFFDATNKFRQCLDERGTRFIGAPDPNDPSSPTNDPAYLDDLGTCASKSNIVSAMEDFNAAQSDLSPEEIKEQNEAFLGWRECMIGKGWKIGKPEPDAQGRLFSLGTGGGRMPQIEAPPGKDLMSSGDLQACASEAAR